MGGNSALTVGRAALATAVLAGAGVPSLAVAQDGLIVQPVIPQGFDRDRNISVLDVSRPSYTPLGVSVGGLLFFPRVETGAGATSNAFLTNSNETKAAFVSLEPSLRVASIWSRHSVTLNASTLIRNYIGQSSRNERNWNLGARGEVELGRPITISAEVNASQSLENQFSGEVATTIAAVSRFRRDFGALRAEYTMGRVRIFGVADHADLRFSPVRLSDGTVRDQENRNRNISRITGQFEYARTPSISVFAQAGYTNTQFDGRQAAVTRLDSGAVRVLGGLNVDLAGRARGTIGVGYSVRDYKTAGFDTVKGLVAEGRVELFPTELFTITTGVRRSVEDATFGNTTPQPFWDNRFSLSADYELLRNLIVSGSGEYTIQTYINTEQRNTTYRIATGARYLISRRLTLDGSVNYTRRQSRGNQFGNEPAEGRIEAGLAFHI
jgi:hypothetical protein